MHRSGRRLPRSTQATVELGRRPEKIIVTVSPNIYKNGINVGVPGTGMRGLHIAAALGAVIDNAGSGLALLDAVDPADVGGLWGWSTAAV